MSVSRSGVLRTAVLSVVLGLVLAACASSTAEPEAQNPTSLTSPSHMDDESPMDDGHMGDGDGSVEIPDGAHAVEVELTDFAFTPNAITVEAGEPVALTVHNMGEAEHDFTVHLPDGTEAPDAHVHAVAGEMSTGVFTIAEPGTYEVWCTVAGHKDLGMVATLTVTA